MAVASTGRMVTVPRRKPTLGEGVPEQQRVQPCPRRELEMVEDTPSRMHLTFIKAAGFGEFHWDPLNRAISSCRSQTSTRSQRHRRKIPGLGICTFGRCKLLRPVRRPQEPAHPACPNRVAPRYAAVLAHLASLTWPRQAHQNLAKQDVDAIGGLLLQPGDEWSRRRRTRSR
ncbi:MAG: hypothetical protein QOD49_51 [Actinomycetota bacterium]|nr:hypothetical protein [Actinomycetota bacterium]